MFFEFFDSFGMIFVILFGVIVSFSVVLRNLYSLLGWVAIHYEIEKLAKLRSRNFGASYKFDVVFHFISEVTAISVSESI